MNDPTGLLAPFWKWAAPFALPAMISLAIAVATWAMVEYLTYWIKNDARRDAARRFIGVVFGQGVMFYVHWSGLYNFGDGPRGWATVFVLGTLTLPLARQVHDRVVAKWAPWLLGQSVDAGARAAVASAVALIKSND